ncbi:MAG: hypothetical protein ABEK01_01595 [Candidatus Nanohaloarchaea archaeon]
MSRGIYSSIRDDWGPEEDGDMYIGFLSAGGPEAFNRATDYVLEDPPSVWESMTDYGLDKLSHLGFSYFGSRAVMKSADTFPEYMKEMEESDLPMSDQIYQAGLKLSEPSMQQKAGLALMTVAVLGTGKEMTDAYFDYLDMTANITGASLGVLNEYGDGSIRKGGEKTLEDVEKILGGEEKTENGPETEKERLEDLDEETREDIQALGKA